MVIEKKTILTPAQRRGERLKPLQTTTIKSQQEISKAVNQEQINVLSKEISLAKSRLDQQLKERERIFGTSPSLSVRRSSKYKDMTALRRAERKIIEELSKALSAVKKGATIDLNKISTFKSNIRSLEKKKTQAAKKRLAQKTGVVLRSQQLQTETIKISDLPLNVQKVILKAQQGKSLTVSDFRIARGSGIGENTLLDISRAGVAQPLNIQQVTEKDLRSSLAKTFGKELASKLKASSLAQLNGLYSSETKEIERKKMEQFLNASIPRNLTTQAQINSLNRAISKERVRIEQTKKSLNSMGFTLTKAEQLINKQLTGQTLTPTDKANLHILNLNAGKKLNLSQWNSIKNVSVIVPAFNYGRNLTLRYNKGENNPLFNDFKIVTKGFGKEAQDFFNAIYGIKGITTNSKGLTQDGLVATVTRSSLEYMQQIIRLSVKNQGLNKVKKDLIKLAKATGVGTISAITLGGYVAKHPVLSSLFVAAAIESGVIKGRSAFMKNPQENLGRALFWLVPISKILKPVEKLGMKINLKKINVNSFSVKQNIATGGYKVKGSYFGTLKNGKDFQTTYKLNYNPKTKLLSGNQVINVEKQRKVVALRLVEKNGYFLDLNSKIKIPIKVLPITKKSVKFSIQKQTPKLIDLTKGSFIKIPAANFQTTTVRIFDGIRKVTTRQTELRFTNKTLAKQVSKVIKKTRTKKFKGLTKQEINDLNKTIDDLGWDLLKGLDRRRKIAKALGLKKNNNLVNNIIKYIDERGNVKLIEKKFGIIKLKGKLVEIKEPRFKINLRPKKLKSLKLNKKGQLSLVKDNKIVIQKVKGKTIQTQKTFIVPNLSSKIPLTPKGLKFYGITLKVGMILKKINDLIKQIQTGKLQNSKKITQKINLIKQDIVKIQTSIKKIDTLKGKKTSTLSKTIKTGKRITPTIKITKLPVKLKGKPIIKPLRFQTKKLPKKGSRQAYQIKIFKGSKIIAITSNTLPLKRAANWGRTYIKKNLKTSTSYRLVEKGKTPIVDVKTVVGQNDFKGTIKQASFIKNKK